EGRIGGQGGSSAAVDGNSGGGAMQRLETLMQLAGVALPDKAMREQISSALDVIVQVSRMSDGRRKVVSIAEVTGMEGSVVTMQEVFVFQRKGMAEDGTVQGDYRATRI